MIGWTLPVMPLQPELDSVDPAIRTGIHTLAGLSSLDATLRSISSHVASLAGRSLLSVASADDDGVVVGGDVLRAEGSPADR